MLKTFSREQIRCLGCFSEEIKAIGVEKVHQMLTEHQTLENEKTSYAVCYFQESCSILLQKYFKSDPDESEIKYKFNVSSAKF